MGDWRPAIIPHTVVENSGGFIQHIVIPQAVWISGEVEEYTPICRGKRSKINRTIERVFPNSDRLSTVLGKLSTENGVAAPSARFSRSE
jgi:hypothetical protein